MLVSIGTKKVENKNKKQQNQKKTTVISWIHVCMLAWHGLDWSYITMDIIIYYWIVLLLFCYYWLSIFHLFELSNTLAIKLGSKYHVKWTTTLLDCRPYALTYRIYKHLRHSVIKCHGTHMKAIYCIYLTIQNRCYSVLKPGVKNVLLFTLPAIEAII